VSKNRVLRRLFGFERDQVVGGWGSLQSEGLHDLYASPNIIGMMKSRRMRWRRNMSRMGEMRNTRISQNIKGFF
jgi:hypothetical protein